MGSWPKRLRKPFSSPPATGGSKRSHGSLQPLPTERRHCQRPSCHNGFGPPPAILSRWSCSNQHGKKPDSGGNKWRRDYKDPEGPARLHPAFHPLKGASRANARDNTQAGTGSGNGPSSSSCCSLSPFSDAVGSGSDGNSGGLGERGGLFISPCSMRSIM